MFVCWIDNQAKRNSSANLMDIKAKALCLTKNLKKDFPHEDNLEFMANTG
jgi:hypothetical protein